MQLHHQYLGEISIEAIIIFSIVGDDLSVLIIKNVGIGHLLATTT